MIRIEFDKIEVEESEKDTFHVNIESKDQSLLIGHHGSNIQALQHILKILCWKKLPVEREFHIVLDIDDYRKRQEESVINLAERKVDMARRSRRPQSLPPMSGYFRRKVHLHLMGAGFDDVETISKGEGEHRHIIIQLKS